MNDKDEPIAVLYTKEYTEFIWYENNLYHQCSDRSTNDRYYLVIPETQYEVTWKA